ncbi:tyrosine-type recombinase/integrase [Rhodocyclus tenuis]|uniref:Tyrosine-type recombinase/integrase n=1 Tax=Rhodocyclus gracilis TaxID=2929842 RepID=A0ABX0WEB9_9RHOO|nr:site-specific integrase [Rhodocyclus gracilis]NJA88077.1 tyrosine-type recombinase/integrase [Rhodocyclus gracilis]
MAKHTLSEKAVKTSAPPAGKNETTLYDGGGLVLRVRNGASGPLRAWQYWYSTAGKRNRIGLGSWPDVSLKAAREKADQLSQLIDAGITPTTKPDTEGSEPLVPKTLNDLEARFARDYLSHQHKDKGESARATYRRHVAPSIGATRLLDLKKLHILHILQPLVVAEKGRTAKGVLALLRQMFSWAVRSDFMLSDPSAGLRKQDFGQSSESRDRHLSEVEVVDLATRLQAFNLAGPKGRERKIPVLPLPTQCAVWIMLSTACRVGELSNARWQAINGKVWTIPAADAKNAREHKIHLSPFARRMFKHLKTFARGSDWVLPGAEEGKLSIGPKVITKQLGDRQQETPRKGRSKNVSALLLEGGPFTSHDLRRTAATLMRANGVELKTIEKCLNHVEQNKLVETYQRADLMPEREAAFDKLGTILERLVPESMTAHLEVTK